MVCRLFPDCASAGRPLCDIGDSASPAPEVAGLMFCSGVVPFCIAPPPSIVAPSPELPLLKENGGREDEAVSWVLKFQFILPCAGSYASLAAPAIAPLPECLSEEF
jgi:hypothetical protein